jgi:outer membrane lipoprotein
MVKKALIPLLPFLLVACAQSAHQSGQYIFDEVLPRDLRSQVDRNVDFSELRATPEQYQDKIVMLSGIVLDAKRKQDRTEIEVLQLPADPGSPPSGDRTRSEGRFLLMKEGLDPATIERGHPITVIGQVKGKAVKMLDETEYTYPVLEIQHLVDWEKVRPRYAGSGYGYGGYPYYPYPYYRGPFGYNPYWYGPYYGPYGYYPYYGSGFGFGGSAPAPSPRAPESIPPRFRKDD